MTPCPFVALYLMETLSCAFKVQDSKHCRPVPRRLSTHSPGAWGEAPAHGELRVFRGSAACPRRPRSVSTPPMPPTRRAHAAHEPFRAPTASPGRPPPSPARAPLAALVLHSLGCLSYQVFSATYFFLEVPGMRVLQRGREERRAPRGGWLPGPISG